MSSQVALNPHEQVLDIFLFSLISVFTKNSKRITINNTERKSLCKSNGYSFWGEGESVQEFVIAAVTLLSGKRNDIT